MPDTQQLLSQIYLTLNGVEASSDLSRDLLEVTVESTLHLPAVASAVALRVVKKHVLADQPILKSTLQEMALADPIHERLGPQMRAVNVAVGKDQSAGGLIQPGDYVDVLLTSSIEWGDRKTTQTVSLARNVRVIVKRNMLWKVLTTLPDDKSVNFTLEDNITRAGLEVKVNRKYYKLERVQGAKTKVAGARGQAIDRAISGLLLQTLTPDAHAALHTAFRKPILDELARRAAAA